MLINALLGVLGLYVMSRIYSAITGKIPSDRFKLDELKEAFKKNSGVWWFMVPLSGALMLLFDAVVSVLWFFGELIELFTKLVKLFISIIKWIYTHIIIGGYFFLLKLLWHYLILIPWRWFRDSFTLLNPASKWNNFKVAARYILMALILVFVGRYINTHISDEHSNVKALVENITLILSVIPIGIGATIITFNRKSQSIEGSWKKEGLNYAKLALIILLPIFILFGLEYLLINLGSRTSFQFSLSTLFAGGGLLASLLILLNAILVSFILSALPSFSLDYKGSTKEVYSSFFKHLYRGWVSYLLAIPAIIIPGFILSIIPGLLTQGSAYLTQQTSNYVYDQRINSLNESANEKMVAYTDWCNLDSISNDSLAKLIEKDKTLLSQKMALADLKKGKQYIDTSYSKFSNRNGAVTLGLLAFMYENYKGLIDENIKTVSLDFSAEIDSSYSEISKQFEQGIVECDTAIAQYNRNIAYYQNQRAMVCVTSVGNTSPEVVSTPENAPAQEQTSVVDACEQQRMMYDNEISKLEESKANTMAYKERLAKVTLHLSDMQGEAAKSVGNESTAKHIGYLFMGIWLCVLAAIALAYMLSMFAHMNALVYDSIDDSSWLIVSEIKSANAANKNQPLLGLLLTLVTGLMLFAQIQSLNWDKPMEIWNKAKESSLNLISSLPMIGEFAHSNEAQINQPTQDSVATQKTVNVEVVVIQDSASTQDSTQVIIESPNNEIFYYD